MSYQIRIADTYGLTDYLIECGYNFEYVDGNNGYDVDELFVDVPFEPLPQNIFDFAVNFQRWFFTNELSND